jgi:hypothetical protein
MRNAHKILIKTPQERPAHRQYNTKTDFGEKGYEVKEWIQVARDGVQWSDSADVMNLWDP